jgi:hypothetical protein
MLRNVDYITSHHNKSAKFIVKEIRSHWHAEIKLHWQLDVSFNEDYNRLRSGNAADNLALMSKIALNLLKNEKSIILGVKNKNLKFGWEVTYTHPTSSCRIKLLKVIINPAT